ncbi:CDPK-related kinase 3 [Canna indica]|uniref:CDPK-related kinase 3 n=1 Tax=Canna indica TaxID=4628 RepID=A0AAQ3Q9W4_9LILI|nr:CDPK-related kinase 3 [Canna indica]
MTNAGPIPDFPLHYPHSTDYTQSSVVQDEVSGVGAGGVPEAEQPLDKNFGYERNFAAKHELDKEVGRGLFVQVCSTRIRRTRTAWWPSRSSPKLRCRSLT